jgi:hypothetical protein
MRKEKWQGNEGIIEVNQVRKMKKWGKHKWLKNQGSTNSSEEWGYSKEQEKREERNNKGE